MRGDLLFYRPSPADLWGHIVALFTNGPFSHVEVDLGDGSSIGALDSGIQRHVVRYVRVTHFHPDTSPDKIDAGVAYLLNLVGLPYGWSDIASQVLRILHLPFFVGESDHYDCSDLVARYLLIAGGMDLSDTEPHLLSPNDLARRAGLLHADQAPHRHASAGRTQVRRSVVHAPHPPSS